MNTLWIASLITVSSLLLDVKYKCRQDYYKYVVTFFLISGICFLFQAIQVEAKDKESLITLTVENKTPRKSRKELHKDFEKKFSKKAKYHYEEGCKALKEAEEISILLPDISEFDKSKFCLVNLIATISPGTPATRLISSAIALCGQYSLLVMGEWQRLQSKLIEAKHHFEMEEHYILSRNYAHGLYLTEPINEKK